MKKNNSLVECHWEITNACNLSCIHCITNSGRKRPKELTTSKAKAAIDTLCNLGCKTIKFTGGEPLMRSDFFKIADYCHKKNVSLELLTNATLIDQKKARRLSSLVTKVGVSIDGSSPSVNDKIRGKGSFNGILRGIKNLRKQKIPVTLFVTLTKINAQDIINILNLGKNFGILEVIVNDLSLSGRALKNKTSIFWDTENKKEILINIFTKFHECNKKELTINDECEAKMTTIFLSSEGLIYPCIEVFQRTLENSCGNISKYSPKQLFEDKRKILNKTKNGKCCYEFIYGPCFRICINKQTKCILC